MESPPSFRFSPLGRRFNLSFNQMMKEKVRKIVFYCLASIITVICSPWLILFFIIDFAYENDVAVGILKDIWKKR